MVQAADFGWVQRARFYWGMYERIMAKQPKATSEWELLPVNRVMDGIGVLRWSGGACPEQWHPHPGWTWLGASAGTTSSVPIPGEKWRTVYSGNQLATLTTVFPHAPDHGAQSADAEQLRLFEIDQRRFPLNTYAAHHCVERDGVLRVIGAEERETVMGYP